MLGRLIAAASFVALGSAIVLQPDSAQVVLVVAAVVLATSVLVSSRLLCASSDIAFANLATGVAQAAPGSPGRARTRSVVRLVLLSQPRR